jgi:GTP pyrophosphokinase
MKLETLLARLDGNLAPPDRDLIQRAYELAATAHEGQPRASGEPYIQHSLAVAKILGDLHLDPVVIAAALLHDVVEDTGFTIEDIQKEFGDEVARLVDGVTKLQHIDQLSNLEQRSLSDLNSESLRKTFLAMVDDVRVVLIKLADRLHNMRTLSALPDERRKRIARETLDVFAPLANRLGIWQMKWELEDLGFRYLEPQKYKEIARLIAERRSEREAQIERILATLMKKLADAGIEADVTGRPKHIYSIYRKMSRKGVTFDQIYDERALRVIVEDVAACYQALGIVHSLWRPIPGEFDDYIATPKDNMYRSLHTAVVADDGKTLEVQIRTQEMHQTAEYGIAAHWRYKEGGRRDTEYENKIAWLRSLLDWRHDVNDATDFVESLKTDVFQDRVYVFTPRGDIIDLPAGATPIDFAYHVHTEVGDRCRGAKANGRLVSLDYQLRTGDQVEILTAKRGGPSRDWLNPHLGYTKTQRARAKIRQWFKRQDRDKNIAQGREFLERELKRLGVDALGHDRIAKLFGYDKVDDFFAAVGTGDINTQQIAAQIVNLDMEQRAATAPDVAGVPVELPALPLPVSGRGVEVRGTGGLLTHLARCCNPLPGDDIVGYITRGRGVTVHRRDCPNILSSEEHERLIEVSWGGAHQTYPVMVKIVAYDRGGLLHEISGIVAGEGINMSQVNSITNRNIATVFTTMEITSIDQLAKVLAKIERVPNVIEARRQTT